jgi:hypothetical protein
MTRTEKLIQQFAHHVAAQTDAIRQGDPKTGNQHAQQYIRAVKALQNLGDQGRNALVPLMHEGRDDVRAMAAAFLLRHRNDEARRVLEDLACGEGIVAFEAGEALKRWEEGTWQLDPA